MCKNLICLFSFVLLLSMTGNVSAELVGYWNFDEGSGTIAYDSSGYGNDGTIQGTPVWITGQVGGALDFDGSTDYVEIPHSDSLSITEQITIAAWTNMRANAGGEMAIVSKGGWAANNLPYELTETAGSEIFWQFYDNEGRDSCSPDSPPVDEWHHIAGTYDGTIFKCYIDGVLADEWDYTGTMPENDLSVMIGRRSTGGTWFNGLIDEVMIYDHALSEDEIPKIMMGLGDFVQASKPSPADGAINEGTWASMAWTPGDFAVSHNVYFGDNFDDVNDGTPETFQGNKDMPYFVVGFSGFAYPEGLVPGTTYYWRIDEVNDADPNSPWKGDVWSFWIPSKTAYDPVPSDRSKFIDLDNPILTWTAGYGAMLHIVYFGDDYETVANAADGEQQGILSFAPGQLEPEKTYYWRVDEFEQGIVHKGQVWSFMTAKVGGGVRADYYTGMNFDNYMLTRTDPQIDFNWGDPGGPDPALGDDNFSCRWTGEVEAAFTETYTFYARADDGVRLWVAGQQLVDAWIDQSATEYKGTIDLIAGNTYSIVMEMYENGGDAVAELRWSSESTEKDFVPQAALAPPVKASSPNPRNGATGTKMTPILRWSAGQSATSHELYFGTDADAVRNATASSPEYKGSKTLGDEIYDPGKLTWYTEYFWRVDEVNNLNPESPWVGNLWSFTTGDFLVIDDFEDYNAGDNQIWYAWYDGLGFGVPGTDPYYAGNGTGAAVGDENTASYTEETIIHDGSQSMPLTYDNNKQGYSKYSETELTLVAPRDWTEEGVGELSLWFRGYPGSVGGFVEGPAGTFTMTASGADIWTVDGVEADEFHFAYKILNGAGSIIAKVDSIDNTNDWAKAGVMIRETLDPDSGHAFMCVTPAQGVSFQRRPGKAATSESDNSAAGDETAPYWVKIDRSISGSFTASHSVNGTTWQTLGIPVTVSMGSNVYIGLAVTSHDTDLTCQAVFSNVTTTGNVTGQWAHQDIGIAGNDPEPLYIAVSNAAGASAVVVHDDPAATQIAAWTEWVIPLQDLADQGLVLTNVDRIAIGLGTRDNVTIPGGSGKMYFDDIRLYRPASQP